MDEHIYHERKDFKYKKWVFYAKIFEFSNFIIEYLATGQANDSPGHVRLLKVVLADQK